MSQKVQKNVRQFYRQQVLSGYGNIIQPPNESSDNSSNEQGRTQKLTPEFWQQKEYQISISLIIETISSGSNEYKYQICINDDSDILISPTSKRGKKMPQQVATIHKEIIKKSRKIPLVYGIHEKGFRTLSYPTGFSIGQGIAEFYSFLLGQLDRTIEYIIQQQKNQKGDDDARKRNESSQSPKSLGANKKTRRGSTVLPEIRDETIPENTTKMDEANGPILGRRQTDNGDRLVKVGNDSDIGNALEGLSLDF